MSRKNTRNEKISSEAGKHSPRCNCGDSEEDLPADVQSRTNYPLVVKQRRGFVGECREGCEAVTDANENKQANLRVKRRRRWAKPAINPIKKQSSRLTAKVLAGNQGRWKTQKPKRKTDSVKLSEKTASVNQ